MRILQFANYHPSTFTLHKHGRIISSSLPHLRPSPPLTFCPMASRPPVPPSLIAPLSHLLSGWLWSHLSSRRRLLSACTSHCTPLPSLVWLVVAVPLIMPTPLVRLPLRLSLYHSCASCPAGCHDAPLHTTASHLPTPPPLIVPLLHWLSRHFSSCCSLPYACTSTSNCAPPSPLVQMVFALPLIMLPLLSA
jgi:hypothetical protein